MIGSNCCVQKMQSCFKKHTRIWGVGEALEVMLRIYEGDRGSGLLQGTISALPVLANVIFAHVR